MESERLALPFTGISQRRGRLTFLPQRERPQSPSFSSRIVLRAMVCAGRFRILWRCVVLNRRNQIPDDTLLQKVSQQLSNRGLRSPCKITVAARNGDITLTGTLQYAHQRQ